MPTGGKGRPRFSGTNNDVAATVKPFVRWQNWLKYGEDMDASPLDTAIIKKHKKFIQSMHRLHTSFPFNKTMLQSALVKSLPPNMKNTDILSYKTRIALRIKTMLRHVSQGRMKTPTAEWVTFLDLHDCNDQVHGREEQQEEDDEDEEGEEDEQEDEEEDEAEKAMSLRESDEQPLVEPSSSAKSTRQAALSPNSDEQPLQPRDRRAWKQGSLDCKVAWKFGYDAKQGRACRARANDLKTKGVDNRNPCTQGCKGYRSNVG